MRFLKLISFACFTVGLNGSEVILVESIVGSSVAGTEYTDVSFVRPVTMSTLAECVNGKRVTSSPIIATMLAKVDPLDKELNINLWVSSCSLDDMG